MADGGDRSTEGLQAAVDQHRLEARSRWISWAGATLNADRAASEAAADRALDAIEDGATAEMAAGIAIGPTGRLPEHLVDMIRSQRARAQMAIEEILSVGGTDPLDSGSVSSLLATLERRVAMGSMLLSQAASGRAQDLPRPYYHQGTAPTAPSVGSNPRRLAAGSGIQIVAYTGAFLLVVATVLFEAYGPARYQAVTRLLALGAGEVIFVAGSLACRRSRRLAPVSGLYLAIAMLLLPTLMVAGGMAAHVGTTGISVRVALTLGAGCCALVYGALGLLLGSRAYTATALLAFTVAWAGGWSMLHAPEWAGMMAAPLVLLYGAMSGPRQPADALAVVPGGRLSVLRPFAEPLAYLSAGAAALLSVDHTPERAWALGTVTLELGAICWYYRRDYLAWPVLTGVAISVLAAGQALHLGVRATAAGLAAVAVAYAWLTWSPRVRSIQVFREPTMESLLGYARWLSVALALASALAMAPHPWWWELAVLGVAAAATCWVSVAADEPTWLVATSMLVTVMWFFAVRGLEHLGIDLHVRTLRQTPAYPVGGLSVDIAHSVIRSYAPLGVVAFAVGMAVSRLRGARWAVPIYGFAAAISSVTVLLALDGRLYWLAGGLLAGALVAVEILGAAEDWPAAAGLALALGGASAASFLAASRTPIETYALAMSATCWIAFAAGLAIRAPQHALWHRVSGMAGLAIVCAVDLLNRATWREQPRGLLVASVVSLALMALAMLVEPGADIRRWSRWAALLVASLIGLPVARLAGAGDPQWYVLGPGLCLLVLGALLPLSSMGDPRSVRRVSRSLVAGGLLLLAGTSAVQMALGRHLGPQALPHELSVPLVVGEGIGSILLGIGLRRRVFVAGGAISVAAGAIWALGQVAAGVPLYEFFALAGAVLIAGATWLAVGRDRFARTRRAMASTWHDWA